MIATPRERMETLDAISRARALSNAESLELEALVRRHDGVAGAGERRPWSRAEERALLLVDRSQRGWAQAMAPIFRRTEAALRSATVRLAQAE